MVEKTYSKTEKLTVKKSPAASPLRSRRMLPSIPQEGGAEAAMNQTYPPAGAAQGAFRVVTPTSDLAHTAPMKATIYRPRMRAFTREERHTMMQHLKM